MGHQLSRYGPSSLSMGIYIDMARLSKYGKNIWNISIDPAVLMHAPHRDCSVARQTGRHG